MTNGMQEANHSVRPSATLTSRCRRSFLLTNALKRIAWTLATLLAVAPVWAGETVLHSFIPNPFGGYPQANVCLGPGNLIYGTALGGPAGAGVVYRVDHSGGEAVAHSFTGGADGSSPYASVICDSAGNVYGTTAFGGSAGVGVVYRVDGLGHESVLYTFTGGNDGGFPFAGLIRDSAGNLYGTTNGGGQYGAGVVFKLDAKGHETVLYSFTGGNDGGYPYGGLIRDSAGNLYGAACCGGSTGNGVVFKLSPSGQESVLWNFTGGNDGGFPYAGSLVLDSTGNLYGTTNGGGQYGAGVVYKVSGMNQESVIYSFTGGSDGGYPYSGVILDSAGNLYGTTSYGGSAGAGVVYKIDPTNHEDVLYSFTGMADGAYPVALVRDSTGNLYGAANGGGPAGVGAVFELDTSLHETVLYGFPALDGCGPWATVTQDSAGNFYGTTPGCGSAGAGVVYKINAAGQESVLYNFTGGADGANPYAGVVVDTAGNLYGTTDGGGLTGAGVVFKIDPTGHETVLHSFTGPPWPAAGTDGRDPNGGVILDSAGNLYGTTNSGGSTGGGVVYKLDPAGNETILYNFLGAPGDGSGPQSGVARDSAGNLYGTTWAGGHDYYGRSAGVVYKLDPSGKETVLYNFCTQLLCLDGADPWAGVALDSAGNLYGATWSGGPPANYYPGVVFKVDATGHETTLYAFQGTTDGNTSRGGVIVDTAGNVYGTTEWGGAACCWPFWGNGVVFEVDATGHETVLYAFTGGADGSVPEAGVMLDSAGNLYGTTVVGGAAGAGVVYKVSPGSIAQPSATAGVQPAANTSKTPSPACSLPHPPPNTGCPLSAPSKPQPGA
jgi:uncharacterized repeat protein (TIGR03803 family)